MKRDMDLVRKILFALEERDDFASPQLPVEGHTEEEIAHHIHLILQAGLVAGCDITHSGSLNHEAMASGLTWQGHEFLDLARNNTTWKKAKASMVQKTGAAGFAALNAVLVEVAKQAAPVIAATLAQ